MSENYTYSKLINSIDQTMFDELNAEISVDKRNHKLTGQTLFSLLLYNICDSSRFSLRTIEESLNSHEVKIIHNGKQLKASKSGIAKRLTTINSDYFEKILKSVTSSMLPHLNQENKVKVVRCDSTIVTLSSKLAKCGFPVSVGEKTQVKFSLSYNEIPLDIRFGTEQSDWSEDFSLKALVKQISYSKNEVVVFDRGISSRKTFADFSQSGILFVTRLKPSVKYEIVKINDTPIETITNTLKILSDCTVQLFAKYGKLIQEPFRLIRTQSLKSGEELCFLTNITDLSAEEITEIYKSRWDIEVFFKFIKQHLHVKHFLSRSLNGIKVVFCMMMVAAVLILTFKKLNKIDSYLIAKIRFIEQLKRSISYQLILLYEGRSDDFKNEFLF